MKNLVEKLNPYFSPSPGFTLRMRFVAMVLVFGGLSGLVTGCNSAAVTDALSTKTSLPIVSISASYAGSFGNFAELYAASDMIALGEIDRVIEVTSGHGSIFFTRFTFRIEKTIKGEVVGEVILNITGSPDISGSDLGEDPIFKPGERYVLFLHEYEEGRFYSMGPWGRYKIIDGRVYSMNRLIDIKWYNQLDLDCNSVTEDEFLGNMQTIMDEVHLTILDSHDHPDTINRFTAGKIQELYPVLSTGRHGPAMVNYRVIRVENEVSITELPLPEGMEVKIEPQTFQGEPGQEYRSIMTITTAKGLQWGSYRLIVRCQYGNIEVEEWPLTFNVEPAGGLVTRNYSRSGSD
jgi:hypothetical protein